MEKTKRFIQDNRTILICATICTLLWGSASPCIKIGYRLFAISQNNLFGQLLFAGIRFTAAGLLTLVLGHLLSKAPVIPKKSDWKGIILLGIVQTFLHYICFYVGLAHTSGAKGTIIYASCTFMSVILAHFFFRSDHMTLKKFLGCSFGACGIILITLSNDSLGSGFRFGDGMMFLSAITFAFGSIINKLVAKDTNAFILTGYQLTLGGVFLALTGIIGGGSFGTVTPKAIALLAYLAILSTIAFSLWTILLKYNRLGKIMVFNFLVPIFGTILSGILLGENVWRFSYFIALLLVSAGIYIVNVTGEQKDE
ncbi:MAG: DMT family transporter [Lachnospiraceae bacterium]